MTDSAIEVTLEKKPPYKTTLALVVTSIESEQIPSDADLSLKIDERVSMTDLLASDGGFCRFASLFVRLASLAREDERLAELLRGYKIDIAHGNRRIWPFPKEGTDGELYV